MGTGAYAEQNQRDPVCAPVCTLVVMASTAESVAGGGSRGAMLADGTF